MPSEPDTRSNRFFKGIPRWAGIGLFFYASVFALSAAKSLLVPVVLGFLLSMVFAPVRRALERMGLHSALASLGIVSLLLGLFMMLAVALSMPITQWVDNAPSIQRNIETKVNDISRSFSELLEANKALQEMTKSDDEIGAPEKVEIERGNNVAENVAMVAPSVFAQFVFTFVLLFFLLASGDMFYEKIVHVLPTFNDKRRAVKLVHSAERKLSRYLLTITVINFSLGIVIGLTMFMLDLPNPVLIGVGAFLLNFVPYVGALVGAMATAAIGLLTFDWYGWALIAGGSYVLINSIEGQLITPYFVGRSLRLNTVVVFLAVSFWAWLWSIVGMVVALPLLVAIKTICDHVDGLGNVSTFLAERHAEERANNGRDPDI